MVTRLAKYSYEVNQIVNCTWRNERQIYFVETLQRNNVKAVLQRELTTKEIYWNLSRGSHNTRRTSY